jgi:hypothetical protein
MSQRGVSVFIFTMGNEQTTTQEVEIVQTALNSITNSSFSSSKFSSTTTATIDQLIEIEVKAGASITCGGNFNVGNNADSKTKALAESYMNKKAEMKTDLVNKLKAAMELGATQSQGPFGALNSQNIDQSMKSKQLFENSVVNSMTTVMDTFVNNATNITQAVKLVIAGNIIASGDCNITNEAVIKALTEAITKLVIDEMFITKIKNDAESEGKGDASQTGGDLSNSASCAAILGAIGLVIVVIIVLVVLKKSAASKGGKVAPAPARSAPARSAPARSAPAGVR